MSCRPDGDAVEYASERVHRGAPPALLRARYEPAGPEFRSAAGSLEEWLTERYCLYAATPAGAIHRLEIDHVRWPLRAATARFDALDLTRTVGLELPRREPHLLFAGRIDVVAWGNERTGA
jgi:hypothetical protein